MKRFILLLRHGAVDRTQDIPDKEQPLKKGAADIHAIANSLAEHLELLPKEDEILIGKIWSGSYKHTIQTAEILYKTLKKRVSKFQPLEFRECKALDPDCFRILGDHKDREMVGQWLSQQMIDEAYFGPNKLKTNAPRLDSNPVGSNATLVVGHAPQINWIAEKILGDTLPIANGELACIAISDFWWDRLTLRDKWLEWTIWDASPDQTKELMKELYEKIDSKMKLAGVLGSLITGMLVFLLKSLLDSNYASKPTDLAQLALLASTVFFFIALDLYLGTMYAYDRLRMPVRFWGERSNWKERRWLVQRPPGSASWIIYQNMVRIWNWLFTPATVAVFLGLLALAYAAFQPNFLTSLIVLFILILSVLYYRNFRPALGTDD